MITMFQNCRDNYGGAQCLSCKPGYYENPYSRRCEICSCPLPIESNKYDNIVVYHRRCEICSCPLPIESNKYDNIVVYHSNIVE